MADSVSKRNEPLDSAPTPEPETIPDRGYRYVTTPEELAECVADLEGTTVLAADIEGDSFFSYTEKTCLLQMTGDSGIDWVVDPLELETIEPLRRVMEDRNVVKIFHGADYDVVSLKRDHDFAIGPIFDTMIAAQATGHGRFGLNDLVQRYFGDTLEKKYQRHDWSHRPFKKEHLEYARLDSHYLPRLREILLEQARERGRVEMLEEEFALLEQREWTGRPFDPDDCLRIKGSNRLDEKQQRVLRAVYVVRDGLARKKDRPSFKVWGNDVMLKVARTLPKDRDSLVEALGEKNHVARRYASEVLAAVKEGLEDTSPIPGPKDYEPPTRNLGVPQWSRDDDPLYQHLKKWRNEASKEAELAPAMIVNNTVLKYIASLKPTTVEDLEAIDDMRNWQRASFGEALVAETTSFLEANPPQPEGDKKKRRRRRRRRGGRGNSGGSKGNSNGAE